MLADGLRSAAVLTGGPLRLAVVGDCLFDVSARALAPVATGGDAPAQIELLPGGQGANMAVRLARRGTRVRLVAPMADDAAGRLLRDHVGGEGVELVALPVAHTGLVLALLDAAGERTMYSSRTPLPRGVTVRHELQRQLTGVDWVHVCGQALADADGGEAVAAVVGGLPNGVRRSADTGSLPDDDRGLKRYRDRLHAARVSLLFAGEAAARTLAGSASAAASTLAALAGALDSSLAAVTIVTGGPAGSAASIRGLSVAVAAYAPDAPVVDATGAGDAYAAAVIDRLAREPWPPSADVMRSAMLAGSELGSRVARVRGAQGLVLGERPAAGHARA